MSYKEKIIKQLRKGYLPIGVSPKEDLNTIFNKTFKPLTERKDLDLFFELAESDEIRLRAWGFLGVYYILKDKKSLDKDEEIKLSKIINDLLNDTSEIKYFGGPNEIITSLREHHIRRLCELDTSTIFKPVFEYVQSFEGKIDEVIGELLENVLSRVKDPQVVTQILKYAKSISQEDFNLKSYMISAFENLGQNMIMEEKELIAALFRRYLIENEEYKRKLKDSNENEILKVKKIKEDILKVAAVLDLNLVEETLEFLNNLTYPYKDLHQIAVAYKNNEKFRSIILNKLEEIENPNLIKDILIAIIALKENIKNWKDIIIEYLNKFQLVDNGLIEELQKAELFSEDMLTNFLNKGDDWQLDFIREFLINNPEKLDEWLEFQNKFIEVLKFFKSSEEDWKNYPNMKEKKELVLKLIIDLEIKDMLKYCLDNVKNLVDNELREIALFSIIKLGNEEIMLELKRMMRDDKELAAFFKKFWRYLERREFKFYY